MKKKLEKIFGELRCLSLYPTLIFAFAVLFGGILVTLFGGSRVIYTTIARPAIAPPAFVFPIVWTILYLLIGGAAGAVFSTCGKCPEGEKFKGLFLFVIMLMLNYIWYPIFFGAGAFLVAFIDIILMIAFTVLIRYFFGKVLYTAKVIITIYLVWLIYAALINISVVFLN